MGLIGRKEYSEAVNVASFKAALRRAREATIGGRAKLEEKTGIDQSTIYRIETDPTYDPSLSTVAALIQGMGLTLADFFAEIEADENQVLLNRKAQPHNASVDKRPLSDTAGHHAAEAVGPAAESRDGVAVHGLSPTVLASSPLADVIGHALIEAGAAILAARAGVSPPEPDRTLSPPRLEKASSGRRRPGHRGSGAS